MEDTMKAKELINLCFDNTEPLKQQVKNLLSILNEEQKQLIAKRGSKSVQAYQGCVKEIAEKYTSICNMLEKKLGKPVLNKNWIETQKDIDPEVRRLMGCTKLKPVYF